MKVDTEINKTSVNKGLILATVGVTALLCISGYAEGDEITTFGTLASNIRGTFQDIAELMLGVAYVAGIGFFIASIFKFKQHKDNPTQIPMGTPIALLMIAICLVFLPYIISTAGATFTGQAAGEGFSAGPQGSGSTVPGLSGDR